VNRATACTLVVVALGAAACSTAAADERSAPATASSLAPPEPESTVAVPAAGPDDDTSQAPGTVPPSTEPSIEPSTAPPTVASTVAVVPGPRSIEDEVADDEPTFQVEPLQPLDLDAAVFAVDDAGIGGTTLAESDPPPTGWAAFDATLEDLLLRNGNTAASVAVSIGGDTVHSAAFGNRTLDGADGAEPGDRFRVASISKTLTSITLLRLVEDGVIGLDDPVGDLVASYLSVGDPGSNLNSITVRRLLNHTSGFGKYDGTFFRGRSVDCRDAAVTGLTSSAGGGSYRYSNMNYCVAGFLIEALTGRPYESVVYEQVLTPLGLSGLRLAPTFDPGPDEVQHPTTTGRNYMETLAAAGAWLASPDDLVAVLNSLDLSTPGWKALGFDTLVAMQTPVNGQFGQRGYGMGLILYGPGRYGHTGTIESTHAMVQNRGDGVIWAITFSGPYPDDTPRLESIINDAFEAGGFIAG
jgi:D-alanyl-D-alanine carboxypeptidase